MDPHPFAVPKVLLIATFPLLPSHEGNRARVLELVRTLKRESLEVHFAYLAGRGPDTFDLAAHEVEIGPGRVHAFFRSEKVDNGLYAFKRVLGDSQRRIFASLRNAERAGQNWLDEYFYAPYAGQLKALQAAHGFTHVIVEYVYLSVYLRLFPNGVVKVVDTIDIFANRHLTTANRAEPYRYFSVSRENEGKGLRRADVALAIQDEEAGYFRELLRGSQTKVATVSHFVPAIQGSEVGFVPAVSFLGSNNGLNREGLAFLLDRVLPGLRSRLPDAQLLVGGPLVDSFEPRPGVVLVGRVETPADLFRRAPLLLNATAAGTGIAIKTLDALACGVPVIGGRSATRGLRDHHGCVLVVPENDAGAYIEAAASVLSDEARWRSMHEEALRTASRWNERQRHSLLEALQLTAR